MRNSLVAALGREVLGPRAGSHEVLARTPLFEYITGVLAPVRAVPQLLDGESELIGEPISGEDAADDPEFPPLARFVPTLDPQGLPHSFGLTFLLRSDRPHVNICATWGEYVHHEERWHRRPFYFVTGFIETRQSLSLTPGSSAGESSNAGSRAVAIHVHSRREGDCWRVSIFLSNERTPERHDHPRAEEHIFQPQLRVICGAGTELAAGGIRPNDLSDADPDDATLSLLYHGHDVIARGHMCAAIWKRTDPQRPCEDSDSEKTRPIGPPFSWDDHSALPPELAELFVVPDVRTEFVPVQSVPMPDLTWRRLSAPELRAAELAEKWEPDDVRQALDPLIEGYASWIDELQDRVASSDAPLRSTAERHVAECSQMLDRMRDAVEMLCESEQIRLAFAFANRAMALQFEWSGSNLVWRAFQLGFVLAVIPSLADSTREDRLDCDLLWVATAAGKTEAYFGVIAMALALRRLRGTTGEPRTPGAGTAVLSRYTLRLLTTQQFRRAVRLITACEVLRVWRMSPWNRVGWRPADAQVDTAWLWGTARFSVGLWVGGEITPNRILDSQYWDGRQVVQVPGALGRLRGLDGDGEPAQVLECPACQSVLAVAERGLAQGDHEFHLVHSSDGPPPSPSFAGDFSGAIIRVSSAVIRPLPSSRSGRTYWTLSLAFSTDQVLSAEEMDRWWSSTIASQLDACRLEAVRASRPGYFVRTFRDSAGRRHEVDFEIFCPNPECPLADHVWAEAVPRSEPEPHSPSSSSLDGGEWRPVIAPFSDAVDPKLAIRVPIPALTSDDQIYHRCPSLIVATVDKMARVPFEPKSAAIFGNVNAYHALFGYYRSGTPPDDLRAARPAQPLQHPRPERNGSGRSATPLWLSVPEHDPPDLILQDELHLIEGPLGSLTGAFETVVDLLASREGKPPKYIASTATIRRAAAQVEATFGRHVRLFPPPGFEPSDSFFVRSIDEHPLEAKRAGRLYVGVAAPGKGAQTPVVRVWSRLLQQVAEFRESGRATDREADPFWTLTGYFNAIRELAGASALYHQDIRERIGNIADADGFDLRRLEPPVELSSRTPTTDLPSLLEDLNVSLPGAAHDAVLTTSMFGVGVDIARLGLMVVHGQPKRNSDYIQATGRIGRSAPGMVVTFYRVTRPRDLSHYEYFVSYHSALHRHVEPVTVFPFAPGVRERLLGPMVTALLRSGSSLLGRSVADDWRLEQVLSGGPRVSGAGRMADHRGDPEVSAIIQTVLARAANQPIGRRPDPAVVKAETQAALDRWQNTARRRPTSLVYWEYAGRGTPAWDVVLGDSWHEFSGRDVVFRNAPQSLRDIEETLGIEV